MHDLHSREVSQLKRLLRQRKSSGDHGLRCNDRGERRKSDNSGEAPFGEHQKEGIPDGFGVFNHIRPLPKIVHDQGGEDQVKPGCADGFCAEMSHVRIERFGPRD